MNDAIDRSALIKMVGDDPAIHTHLLTKFVDTSAQIIAEILDTCRHRNNAETIADLAHKLKSSSMAMGAIELGQICSALESAGKSSDWITIAELESRLDPILSSIREYVGELKG